MGTVCFSPVNHYSTGTHQVMNDLRSSANPGNLALPVLLHLSSKFDRMDLV